MLYEYRCEDCGDTFERSLPVDKRNEPTKGLCGLCDCVVKRQVSTCSFQLKGDCWERDSYQRGSDFSGD